MITSLGLIRMYLKKTVLYLLLVLGRVCENVQILFFSFLFFFFFFFFFLSKNIFFFFFSFFFFFFFFFFEYFPNPKTSLIFTFLFIQQQYKPKPFRFLIEYSFFFTLLHAGILLCVLNITILKKTSAKWEC